MKKILVFIVVMLMLSSVTAVSDSELKDILKRVLFEQLEDPDGASLELEETKDLLTFYLAVLPEQETVNLNVPADNSPTSIQDIVSKAVQGKQEAPPPDQTCTAGWKCQTKFHRAYQNTNCMWQSVLFCEHGCAGGQCTIAELSTTTTTKQETTSSTKPSSTTTSTTTTMTVTTTTFPITSCIIDADCGAGFSCTDCYLDNDGDGYGMPGYAEKKCTSVQMTCEDYEDYSSYGHDIDDNDPRYWYYADCYVDNDGDMYGAEGSTMITVPAGLLGCRTDGNASDNDEDCYDNNDKARPFTNWQDAVHRGDSSFDYNCDGTISKKFAAHYDIYLAETTDEIRLCNNPYPVDNVNWYSKNGQFCNHIGYQQNIAGSPEGQVLQPWMICETVTRYPGENYDCGVDVPNTFELPMYSNSDCTGEAFWRLSNHHKNFDTDLYDAMEKQLCG